MTSIAMPFSLPSVPCPPAEPSLLLRNQLLSGEVSHLRKVVALKDGTLEEIRSYISQLVTGSAKPIESFSIVEKSLEEAEGGRGERVRRALSYEISAEIDENIAESMQAIHQQFNSIFEKHRSALQAINTEFEATAKNSQAKEEIASNSLLDMFVVEVPVELSVLKETATQATQVDLFESPKNSERNEEKEAEGSEGYLLSQQNIVIREVPVELVEVYEIPVDLILLEDYEGQILEVPNPAALPQHLMDELALLRTENSALRKQIGTPFPDEHPYYFEIEITTPDIQVPFDSNAEEIEVPIEFVITNDGHSDAHFEIVEQSQQVPSKEVGQSRQAPSEWSPQGKNDQMPTRSEISSSCEELVGVRNRLMRLVKEESIILESKHGLEKQPILIQDKPAEVRYVEVPVIQQVFVDRIVEVPVELVVERVKYVEVPISKIEEVEVYRLWPVEVEVEKIVEVSVIKEVPKQVFVDREVLRTSYVKVPVIKEIPTILESNDSEDTIEIPIHMHLLESTPNKLCQSPEEPKERIVYVDKIVYVDRIVEVPIEVLVEREKVIEVETIIRETNEIVIRETNEITIEKNVIYEVPVEIEVIPEKEKEQDRESEEEARVQCEQGIEKNHFEAGEVELYFHSDEFNDHELVIEIPEEMMVERVVEVPVEKIVEVFIDRVVQVPVQVFVDRVVEVAVEVIRVVQVPVEVLSERVIEVYVPYVVEVPLELHTSPSLIQIPVHMEMDPLIYEVPVDVVNPVEVIQVPIEMQEPPLIYEVPIEMNMQHDTPDLPARLESKPEGVTKMDSQEEVFLIPLHRVDEISIENNDLGGNRGEIVVEIPVERSRESREVGMQTEPAKPQLVEIPIELDLTEETRRGLELRYHEKASYLNGRYEEEIKSLLEVVENLQRIIVESTHEREQLAEELQGKALLEEQLHKQIMEAELIGREASEAKEETQAALAEQQRRNRQLLQEINNLVSSPPIVYELPVELTVLREKEQEGVQTEDLVLSAPSVIEVAVEMQVVERVSDSQLRSDKPFKYFKGYTEEEVQEKLREIAVKPELVDRGVQIEIRESIDETELDIKAILQQGDSAYIPDEPHYMRPDVDQSQRDNLISGIECAQDYEHMIDEIRIYEYALEVIPEPIIYEVPIDLRVFKESAVSEVQTDDARERPRRTEEVQIQTEDEYGETCSGFAVSRLIEIPIELTIEFDREAISVDIQTEQCVEEQKVLQVDPPTSEDFRQAAGLGERLQLSRFDIVQLVPVRPSEVIRLQSACYSISDQFGNQSLTIDLPNAERLNDYDSKFLSDSHDLREALVIITSHHNDKDRHDVILEENEERSRAHVHIDEELNDLNFQEVQEIQERAQRSDIKQNYSELYENAATEAEKYRLLLEEREQENVLLGREMEGIMASHQEKVGSLEEELGRLEKRVEAQEATIEEQRAFILEASEARKRQERKIEQLVEEYERFKDYNSALEESSGKEVQRLKAIITERLYEIKELKSEQYQMKELYEGQIQQLRAKIQQKKEMISELEDENQRKGNKIEQLYDYQEELRKNIAYIRHNSESSAAALYEQEFLRVKEDFEETRRALEDRVRASAEEAQQLKEELAQETAKNQQVTEEANELDHALARLEQDYLQLKNGKAELECSYLEGVKELQGELQELRDLLREKDNIIQQLQERPGRLEGGNNPEEQPPRMEYLSRKASRQVRGEGEGYVRKLEGLLVRYERMLANSQVGVQELQEKVCEYLRDALEKEHEAEMLYCKLVEYEAAMNSILVEKITLEIENKRMAKSLELSERKILILGNKLIEAAGRRQGYESSDEDYYYQ